MSERCRVTFKVRTQSQVRFEDEPAVDNFVDS
jgi:hypothetical protein